MSRQRPTLLLVLLGLAAGSWWLAGPHGTEPAADPAARTDGPGYYLDDATLEQSDATGRTTLIAHAARAEQAETGGDISLSAPMVRYRAGPGRTWLMTARRGRLPQGQSLVLLDDDVALRAEDRSGAVVHTSHLELDVAAQRASTSEPVRIEMPPHELHAGGLHADLTQETLRLEGSVHGTFSR